jgi:hypothetical protein
MACVPSSSNGRITNSFRRVVNYPWELRFQGETSHLCTVRFLFASGKAAQVLTAQPSCTRQSRPPTVTWKQQNDGKLFGPQIEGMYSRSWRFPFLSEVRSEIPLRLVGWKHRVRATWWSATADHCHINQPYEPAVVAAAKAFLLPGGWLESEKWLQALRHSRFQAAFLHMAYMIGETLLLAGSGTQYISFQNISIRATRGVRL